MCCNCLVIIEFYDSLKSVAGENIAWNQQKFTTKKKKKNAIVKTYCKWNKKLLHFVSDDTKWER